MKYQVMRDLTREEYSALKASVEENGVLVPVVLDEHGNIIDGHHRKMVCDEIGATYPVQVVPGMTEAEKLNMARQLNEARRQLTPEEKRQEIERRLREAPEVSDRQIAKAVGVDHKTVTVQRTALESTGEIPQLDTNIGADGKERPRQVARRPVAIFNPTPAEQKAMQNPAVLEKLIDGTAQTVADARRETKREEVIARLESVKASGGSNIEEIIEGDLFDEVHRIGESSVDLLFADPPYMILGERWDEYEGVTGLMGFTKRWLDAVMPKLKSTGRAYISFSQYYQFDLYNLLRDNGFYGLNFGQVIVWNYRNNNKPSDRMMYRFAYEPVFYLYGKDAGPLNLPPESYGETQSNVWTIATPQSNFGEGKYHPAQKPLELLERIIMTGSRPGDLVFDPFGGSGTTAVAAKKMGRRYALIERDPEYCRIARGRLSGVG